MMTLTEFITIKERDFQNATGNLTALLNDIVLAAKTIHRDVNRAGLMDIIGATGDENIQGEVVQKLDIHADQLLIKYLKNGGQCCGIGSEENDTFIAFDDQHKLDPHYVVLFDPLDGSSNIDVCAPIGTIFSIYKKKSPGKVELSDFLQKGTEIVAAGYVIYGSSTMLVFSTGRGVNGFTLDASIGEFCLSHPDIKTPEMNNTYSINQGGMYKYEQYIHDFVDWCSADDKDSKRPYSLRYIGSMVADFHRNLLKGGIFIYPAMKESPQGKLRILYECIPMAFLQEQAGGIAIDGEQRILEKEVHDLHQRTPIIIGSKKLVEKLMSFK